MIIAQQFTAGNMGKQGVLSPVGTTEPNVSASRFKRPYGTKGILMGKRPSDESLGYYQPTLRVGRTGLVCNNGTLALSPRPRYIDYR